MQTNDRLEFNYVIQPEDTATIISLQAEDTFAEVLATPRMIALMELAASRLMIPIIPDGYLSVGVGVNINHLAPTSIGQQVSVTAIYKGMKGQLHNFSVTLSDHAGIAGSGNHTRAIVDKNQILERALKRAQ